MSEPLLIMRGISKSFPGVQALSDVSFTLERGSVHALMGENGAGKSTLMKCLFGVHAPDGGEILLEGQPISFSSPAEALVGGIAMVHQELNQADKLSVAENMCLGRFPKHLRYLPFVNRRKMREDTKRLFSELGITTDPDKKIEELSVSERQMVEIAKAVSYGAKVIVNVPEGIEEVGFIVRRDCSDPGGTSWGEATKDATSEDRFAVIEGEETFIYLKSGDAAQYTSQDGGKTLTMIKKFTLAGMTDFHKIQYNITPKTAITSYKQVKVYEGDRELTILDISNMGKEVSSGIIEVEETLDISKNYRVVIEGYGEKAGDRRCRPV